MPDGAAETFEPSLGCLIEPAMTGLAAQLRSVRGLEAGEARAVGDGAATVIAEAVQRKVSRVLLLELNAARITGQLRAPDPAGRWQEWIGTTTRLSFWESLAGHYPSLLRRIRAVIDNRCAAALTMAARFAADRDEMARLPGAGTGALTGVAFGAGDSHRQGQTVAVVRTTAGRVVYKPRSVTVDASLAGLLDVALAGEPRGHRIRVPDVLARPGYGWAEYVEHRYCAADSELRTFYRGIGHWLAVMRLVGGSDLHAENVIAVGPIPVVVDCETLFTPHSTNPPSGYGLAHDRAAQLIADSALRTGLLPGRGQALGWRGVDPSGAGALPGQQPYVTVPVIVGAGTDEARLGYESQPVLASGNHPSPDPVLSRYWSQVVDSFTDMTARLHELDRSGRLSDPLSAFADCPIRVVVRPTETYMELTRMLWHPASLHDETAAVGQAAGLLAAHAANAADAPADPEVIGAEVAELLDGDIPVFATTPRTGRLAGPRGTAFGPARDLVADALSRWRASDHGLDRRVISDTLVSAYLNEGWIPADEAMVSTQVSDDDLDRRRRRTAAAILRTIRDAAIRAEDGTITWIAPVISPTGWAVRPLSNDIYNGLSGVAVVLAAYEFEVAHGRADAVTGLEGLLQDTLRTLQMIEAQDELLLSGATAMRPDAPGGYVGLGSLIWAWLLLGRLGIAGLNGQDALPPARVAAGHLTDSVGQDDSFDLFRGMAGAIVPLLRLAERTGEPRWSALADKIGTRLVDTACRDGAGARWGNPQYPDGIGGTAHGATGIGWALARLSAGPAVTQPPGETALFGQLAEEAFAFEEALYDAAKNGWNDLREPGHVTAAWCHGGGGIGVVAADLGRADPGRWRDVLRRAAASCWAHGLGWNHTLCHGDLGVWEVIDRALAAGVGPSGVDRVTLDARIIGGLGEFGPVSGVARDALAPGLMPGIGGMAYQLLRMHPRSPLPSVLLPDPGPASPL